jgi:hypothetical protein
MATPEEELCNIGLLATVAMRSEASIVLKLTASAHPVSGLVQLGKRIDIRTSTVQHGDYDNWNRIQPPNND